MEILDFNAKHHVVFDILKHIGWFITLEYSLECNLQIFHLFLNSILPERIHILLVHGICLFDCLRQLNLEFMGLFKATSTALSCHGDKSLSFLQDMMSLPVKCQFMLNALCYGIFDNVDWV